MVVWASPFYSQWENVAEAVPSITHLCRPSSCSHASTIFPEHRSYMYIRLCVYTFYKQHCGKIIIIIITVLLSLLSLFVVMIVYYDCCYYYCYYY